MDAGTLPAGAAEGVPRRPTGTLARARAFVELAKPGITAFVVIVAAASFHAAAPTGAPFLRLLHALVGAALSTGGALALNQYLERDLDAMMERTRTRPLPSGRLTPREALAFGTALAGGGIAYLAITVGPVPAAVATVSAVLYIFVYTPLKRVSPICTLVGAIPGSLPTLIGWTAAAGRPDAGGWALFAILYLWQLPHVLAISWLLRDDYRRAGFRMAPVLDRHGVRTGPHAVLYTAALLPISLLPTILGLAGPLYFFGALALGLLFLAAAAPAARGLTDQRARRVFFGSLVYLPLLLTIMSLS